MLAHMSEMRYVVAANIRARMAWAHMTQAQLQQQMGWTRRTTHNKVKGHAELTAGELVAIAELFGVEPGALYRVPDDFPVLVSSPSASSTSALAA